MPISEENFVIKRAVPEDVPLILSLIKEIAEYEKLSHEVVATEETLNNSLFGENANTEVIIGYYDDKPAGYAVFFHNFSTFIGKSGIYLEDIYVKPELRGKGIGKKLFLHLVKLAVERNCGRMEWSVLNWNSPAINFYQKLGAKAMDEWTVFRLTEDKLNKLAESVK